MRTRHAWFLVLVLTLIAGPLLAPPAATAVPKCDGKKATIYLPSETGDYFGTDGNDVIVGSNAGDNIDSGAGNDTICGGEGDDMIFADVGRDTVFGGAGDDQLYGEGGRDLLRGQGGNDSLYGYLGRDTCLGGSGTDHTSRNGGCEKQRRIEVIDEF